MIDILRGIREDQPLPAIGVAPLERANEPFSLRVYEGLHRFYASAAVGFTHVPAFVPDKDLLALALRSQQRHT